VRFLFAGVAVAVLDTVGEYVTHARTILQDTTSPYRYATADLKEALALAVYDARRVRPDLFLTHNATVVPDLTSATADGTAVTMDKMYRFSLVHYMVGHVMKRDEEEVSEARASAFLQAYRTTLVAGL
jgi:hypothetical protein